MHVKGTNDISFCEIGLLLLYLDRLLYVDSNHRFIFYTLLENEINVGMCIKNILHSMIENVFRFFIYNQITAYVSTCINFFLLNVYFCDT